jgi:hypothetical protein
MASRPAGRRVLQLAIAVMTVALAPAAAASTWTVGLRNRSHAEATSQQLPSTPSNVSSACVSSSQAVVKVTWSPVAGATYTVYQSTTSATSGYSAVASGLSATSWTSGTLSGGTYWYEVAAQMGSNWASSRSAATAARNIGSGTCA